MSNPDGLDINWVYKYNNTLYLPLLIFDSYNRKVKQILITLKKSKTLLKHYTIISKQE